PRPQLPRFCPACLPRYPLQTILRQVLIRSSMACARAHNPWACRSPRGPCPTWGGSSAFLSPRKVRRGPSARFGFFYEGGRVLAHRLGTIMRRTVCFRLGTVDRSIALEVIRDG